MFWLAGICDAGGDCARLCTVTCSQGGEFTDFGIVCIRERSVDVLQATGSLLLQSLLCFSGAVFLSRLMLEPKVVVFVRACSLDRYGGLCIL